MSIQQGKGRILIVILAFFLGVFVVYQIVSSILESGGTQIDLNLEAMFWIIIIAIFIAVMLYARYN